MLAIDIILSILFGTENYINAIFALLFSIGLMKIFEKCGIKKWWAFVPCAKYYMLGKCANREQEGRVASLSSFAFTVANIVALVIVRNLEAQTESIAVATIITLLLYMLFWLVMSIYTIRITLGLCEVFNKRKRWVILWVLYSFIPALIWGFSSKAQPLWRVSDMKQETAAMISGKTVTGMGSGLTINLEERTVTDFFQKKYLLRDIHMYIKPGSLVLLLGGSGAGKTTFLNAVNGYEKAKAKIILNGKDVYADYSQMQYEVGFVPQQDLMRLNDTVYNTLMDAAKLRLPADASAADRKKRVKEVLQIFGLEPSQNNLVVKLSGGQRKRLSIAMEFISNPSLFMLDEPDSGLDGVMARELMEHLRNIADQGKIVMVITHTPDRVIDLFDSVIVLAKDADRTGRLAFYGSVDEAKAFFGTDRMEKIVLAINRKEEGGEGLADEYINKFTEVQHVAV